MKRLRWAATVISSVMASNAALSAPPEVPSISEDQGMSANGQIQTGLVRYCVSNGVTEETAINAD